MDQNLQSAAPIVGGVTDTRHIPLGWLAANAGTAHADLAHVLPGGANDRLPLCAFGSSI